jgi:hypothetical protein
VPVSRSDPRRAVVIALGAIVAAGAILFLAAALGGGLGSGESTPFGPDDPEFDIGPAAQRSATIAGDGVPLFFPDAANGTTPIWVNHLGEDPATGWVAFDAAVAADCLVAWDAATKQFEDCNGRRYPPGGDGLHQYDVRVEEGNVVVDLAPDEGSGE